MRDESKVHFSQVDTYEKCPRKYKYKYVDKIRMMRVPGPNDPLLIGTTAHLGHETDYKTAEKFYMSQYMVMTDDHINELIKIEHWVNQVKEFFSGFEVLHIEYNIETDDYQGQIDVITASDEPGYVDIWDLKYSNNDQSYDGTQLNVYEKFLTLTSDMKVKFLNYVFMPKTFIRQKQSESTDIFRRRMRKEIESQNIRIIPVQKSAAQLKRFAQRVLLMQQDTEFDKAEDNKYCKWCEYSKICKGEEDYLMLPNNTRVDRRQFDKLDKWIIGPSYSGKSTFMDQFDDTLFFNTDGNVDQITSPIIRVKDEIWKEGRITKKKLAWVGFKEFVTELETNHEHGFKKVCLDLIEDLYEHCRIYKYAELNIDHESDAGFGKGWDIIRTEFLSTIKRLKNIGLEVTYISKSVTKSVKNKGGSEVTTYLPNIPDKVANVLAGTVGATFLIDANGSERYLTCGQSPYHFRGTRYDLPDKIELNKDKYLKELEIALKKKELKAATTPKVKEAPVEEKSVEKKEESTPDTKTETKSPRAARKPKVKVDEKTPEVKDEELPEVLQEPENEKPRDEMDVKPEAKKEETTTRRRRRS
jgi:CRISPR/Cas system-associated exonuclease Cas4 (RecB family)